MPILSHFPVYGQARPGTNSYVYGGGSYGGYNGAFGEATPTNAAVMTRVPDPMAQALRQQAALHEAAGVAAIASGRRAQGAVSIRTAAVLKQRAAAAAAQSQRQHALRAATRNKAIMSYRRLVGSP